MSQLEDSIYEMLKKAFPNFKIDRQFYINISGHKLFFDFYLPNWNLLIEVQGQQHYNYSSFFHSHEQNFYRSKYRDSLKKEWAKDNGYIFIEINRINFPMNYTDLIDLIYKEVIK